MTHRLFFLFARFYLCCLGLSLAPSRTTAHAASFESAYGQGAVRVAPNFRTIPLMTETTVVACRSLICLSAKVLVCATTWPAPKWEFENGRQIVFGSNTVVEFYDISCATAAAATRIDYALWCTAGHIPVYEIFERRLFQVTGG